MPRSIRRVVTGHDANGKSVIVRDDSPPSFLEVESMPGFAVFDLWETTTSPADNRGDEDAADRPVHLEPVPTGTIFRVICFPPDSAWKSRSDSGKAFETVGGSHARDESSSDPMMHKTASVDYAVVLSGEIWAVLEEDETCLRAGDVLVQRGTNHSWSVRGDEPAYVAFILVGARPV